MNGTRRLALGLLLATTLLYGASAPPAAAAVVSTSEALAAEQDSGARATVDGYLAREDVASDLAALGVDPELARLRAAALSPSELEALAGRIEDNPAGGGVIGVLGVTFLVLLILEWVGVIDIFKKP
jgi:Family of unknown function (DUF6627)